MNRRHLLAAPLAVAAVPAAAVASTGEDLPGAEQIRIWSNMAVSAYAGQVHGMKRTEPQALAALAEIFERVVGPFPYRYRSPVNGKVIVATHLCWGGLPAISYEDGTPLGRQD